MKVNVFTAWQNYNVTIQRKPANPGVNSLGEPDYGNPSTYPVVLDPDGNETHRVRIEYNVENLEFTPTGERVYQKETLMFVSVNDFLMPDDRVTIVSINNVAANTNPNIPNYFIIYAIWPESDAVGNVSHQVAELQNV